MKKNAPHILIGILVIAQIWAVFKIGSLQEQISIARNEIGQLHNNTRMEIDSIYSNVDERLKQQASLIEKASVEIGAIDTGGLTAPITFSLTPKEVGAHTAVSLDMDGTLFPMDKSGTSFSVTIPCGLFDSVLPAIVIDEDGLKKTTQDDRLHIFSMKDELFPIFFPHLNGGSQYNGAVYTRKGTLNMETKPSSRGVAFTKMRLVAKVDDAVISNEEIPAGASEWEVDQSVPLGNGQVYVMTVVAADSIGLEHHYIVDYWVGGADRQREIWFDNEKIYTAGGKLLWEPEYNRVYG